MHQLVVDASRRLLSWEQAQKCLLANKKTFVTHYESLVHSYDAYLLSSACTHLQQLLNWSECMLYYGYSIIIIIITSTVEPQYNKGWREWQNLFAITRFCYIEVLFHLFYYYQGKENRSLYWGLHYIEFRYIEVPL